MHLSIHPSISISVDRFVLGDGPNPNPHHTQHRFVLGDGVLPVEGMPRRPRQLVAHAWLGLGFIGLGLGLELGLELGSGLGFSLWHTPTRATLRT